MLRLTLLMLICVASSSALLDCLKIKTLQWTGGSFHKNRNILKQSGFNIKKNVIATRAQQYQNDLFLAIPRMRDEIPVTLAVTCMKPIGCQVVLQPFPNWPMQKEGKCKALQSVVDLYLDANEVLWVLDTGIVNSLDAPVRKCPPKIVAFNPKTRETLKVLDLSGLVTSTSRLQNIVVDYSSSGRCYVYVSDATTRAILVFDVAADKGYRVVLPKDVTAGCTCNDVLYLALTRNPCGKSTLFFTYLCSNRMFSINTEYLQKQSTQGRIQDVGPKYAKFAIIGTDGGTTLFARAEGSSDILSWDTRKPLTQANFRPVYRSETCMVATHVIPDNKCMKMRVLESNFPDYIQGAVGCGAVQKLSPIE